MRFKIGTLVNGSETTESIHCICVSTRRSTKWSCLTLIRTLIHQIQYYQHQLTVSLVSFQTLSGDSRDWTWDLPYAKQLFSHWTMPQAGCLFGTTDFRRQTSRLTREILCHPFECDSNIQKSRTDTPIRRTVKATHNQTVLVILGQQPLVHHLSFICEFRASQNSLVQIQPTSLVVLLLPKPSASSICCILVTFSQIANRDSN